MSAEDDYIGEPGYPAPWATTLPREGLRDTDEARIVCLAPDVCKSPSAPIPYMIVDYCGHDQGYTPSVRFTSQKAMVLRSRTTDVHGDVPGVGKGVKSGTVGGICEPIGHASQLRAEGSPVIRHLDRFYMNNRNTVGEALFVRDTATYRAPVNSDPLPGSLRRASAERAPAPASPKPEVRQPPRPPGQVIRPNVPQWQRLPAPAPGIGRLGTFGRLLGRLSLPLALLWPEPLGDGTLPAWEHQTPQDDYERWLQGEARRRYLEDPRNRPQLEREYRDQLERHRADPAPAPAPDNTRVDRPKCYVLPLTFTTPQLGTVTEMRRQLALQQTALNAKNPCQAATDIARYPVNKPIGERERPRSRERSIQVNAARLTAINPSLSADAALALARTAAIGKDAIHTLDMVAGGNPLVFSGLGGRSENRSIGVQWGPGGKAAQLAAYAQNQCQNGCPAMQTMLTAI